MSVEDLWIALRNRGYSPTATAAIMGNMQDESALRSDNVEDRCPLSDADYTAQVDSGRISREEFIRDAYGYGLCQWTYYTRKAGLYDLCRSRGVSIASYKAQLDWMDTELGQAEYQPVRSALRGNGSLYEMTAVFMWQFERPEDQSDRAINMRTAMAQAIYNELAGVSLDKPADEPDDPEAAETYWPPRTVDESMEGPDVQLYQAALLCHGYSVLNVNGLFDGSTTQAVKRFQADHGLTVDGVIGPVTSRVLLMW